MATQFKPADPNGRYVDLDRYNAAQKKQESTGTPSPYNVPANTNKKSSHHHEGIEQKPGYDPATGAYVEQKSEPLDTTKTDPKGIYVPVENVKQLSGGRTVAITKDSLLISQSPQKLQSTGPKVSDYFSDRARSALSTFKAKSGQETTSAQNYLVSVETPTQKPVSLGASVRMLSADEVFLTKKVFSIQGSSYGPLAPQIKTANLIESVPRIAKDFAAGNVVISKYAAPSSLPELGLQYFVEKKPLFPVDNSVLAGKSVLPTQREIQLGTSAAVVDAFIFPVAKAGAVGKLAYRGAEGYLAYSTGKEFYQNPSISTGIQALAFVAIPATRMVGFVSRTTKAAYLAAMDTKIARSVESRYYLWQQSKVPEQWRTVYNGNVLARLKASVEGKETQLTLNPVFIKKGDVVTYPKLVVSSKLANVYTVENSRLVDINIKYGLSNAENIRIRRNAGFIETPLKEGQYASVDARPLPNTPQKTFDEIFGGRQPEIMGFTSTKIIRIASLDLSQKSLPALLHPRLEFDTAESIYKSGMSSVGIRNNAFRRWNNLIYESDLAKNPALLGDIRGNRGKQTFFVNPAIGEFRTRNDWTTRYGEEPPRINSQKTLRLNRVPFPSPHSPRSINGGGLSLISESEGINKYTIAGDLKRAQKYEAKMDLVPEKEFNLQTKLPKTKHRARSVSLVYQNAAKSAFAVSRNQSKQIERQVKVTSPRAEIDIRQVLVPKVIPNVAQIPGIKRTQIPLVTTDIIQGIDRPQPPRITRYDIPRPSEPPPPPRTPPPFTFSIPSPGGFGGLGSRNIGSKRITKYTPSFAALVYNIRGRKPSGTETGLRVRPITKGFSWAGLFKVRR